MRKPIEINMGSKITVHPEGVYEGEVVKSGNGAVIKSFKRFVGKKVFIIIKEQVTR